MICNIALLQTTEISQCDRLKHPRNTQISARLVCRNGRYIKTLGLKAPTVMEDCKKGRAY
jgi:hypothetical protein